MLDIAATRLMLNRLCATGTFLGAQGLLTNLAARSFRPLASIRLFGRNAHIGRVWANVEVTFFESLGMA